MKKLAILTVFAPVITLAQQISPPHFESPSNVFPGNDLIQIFPKNPKNAQDSIIQMPVRRTSIQDLYTILVKKPNVREMIAMPNSVANSAKNDTSSNLNLKSPLEGFKKFKP